MLNERESIRRERFSEKKNEENTNSSDEIKNSIQDISKDELADVSNKNNDEEKVSDPQI